MHSPKYLRRCRGQSAKMNGAHIGVAHLNVEVPEIRPHIALRILAHFLTPGNSVAPPPITRTRTRPSWQSVNQTGYGESVMA